MIAVELSANYLAANPKMRKQWLVSFYKLSRNDILKLIVWLE